MNAFLAGLVVGALARPAAGVIAAVLGPDPIGLPPTTPERPGAWPTSDERWAQLAHRSTDSCTPTTRKARP